MGIKSRWLLFIFPALVISNAYAQNILPDSTAHTLAVNKAIDLYNETIGEHSEIYNGALYSPATPGFKGSAYFQDKNYPIASYINYNGTLYKNVRVFYDVYNDVMVAVSRGYVNYVLRYDKVADVYLANHHFIYLDAEKAGNLPTGFYDQLYSGKVTVLVKRTKSVTNNVTARTVEVLYEDETSIYIKKGDKYYPVDSKGSVLSVFKDKKKELNQYLGSNKIRYNKDREASIAAMAQYYDQLTN